MGRALGPLQSDPSPLQAGISLGSLGSRMGAHGHRAQVEAGLAKRLAEA